MRADSFSRKINAITFRFLISPLFSTVGVQALFPIICALNSTSGNATSPSSVSPKPICTRLVGDEPAYVCVDLRSNFYRVQFRDCLWLRLNVEEAKALLKGKHLVFIGDSRIRYQYLSLLYWLLTGKVEVNSTSRCIANEKVFGSWHLFYRETNAAVSQFGAKELCDCYRNAVMTESIENRHWEWAGMKITYFQQYDNLIRGHTLFATSDLGCLPGNCSAPALWRSNVGEAIDRIIRVMNVTHIVVTNGWRPASELVSSSTWNKTAYTLSSRGIRVFVMERSQGSKTIPRQTYPPFVNRERLLALDVFSTHYYPLPSSRWDIMHYHPWVYSDFSQLLLHAIAEARGT